MPFRTALLKLRLPSLLLLLLRLRIRVRAHETRIPAAICSRIEASTV
jgi:hypothetical protein